MPSLTPRATVVWALAKREAELLGQSPASGHVLVALIWEEAGVAAAVLADTGLPKGADEEIRARLADAPESQRGLSAADLQRLAGAIAAELDHDYIGTEHQLLAITRDDLLGETVLSADVRKKSSAGVHQRLARSRGH